MICARAIAVLGVTTAWTIACCAEFMHFPFDEIAGNVVIGPQLNGTAMNFPVLVPGIRGQALSLDGVSQFVDFGNTR